MEKVRAAIAPTCPLPSILSRGISLGKVVKAARGATGVIDIMMCSMIQEIIELMCKKHELLVLVCTKVWRFNLRTRVKCKK